MGGVYKYFMTVKVISGCVRSSLVLDIVKALKSGSGAECHVYKVGYDDTECPTLFGALLYHRTVSTAAQYFQGLVLLTKYSTFLL